MGKRSDKGDFLSSRPSPLLAAMGEQEICLIDSTDGRDFYPTPYEAVVPLLPHLAAGTMFEEPCAGNGMLVDHLEKNGHHNTYSCDIKPGRADVLKFNAFDIAMTTAEVFITNPPWTREIIHPLITHLSDIAPTWLLFDADWAHTKQSAEFMQRCRKIVSVGRIKWIPDSKMTGKDNCAWYLFDKPSDEPTKFYGRSA